jgi:hypothetical protein
LSKREGRERQENARRNGPLFSRKKETGKRRITTKKEYNKHGGVYDKYDRQLCNAGARMSEEKRGKRGKHARKSKRAKERNHLKLPSLPQLVLHPPLKVSVERRGVPERSEREESPR